MASTQTSPRKTNHGAAASVLAVAETFRDRFPFEQSYTTVHAEVVNGIGESVVLSERRNDPDHGKVLSVWREPKTGNVYSRVFA